MTCFVSCPIFKIDMLEWKLYELLLLKEGKEESFFKKMI